MNDVWVPRRLECLLECVLAEPKVPRLFAATACLADAQVKSKPVEPWRGGFASSIRICKQHRGWEVFLLISKGGLPCLAHTLFAPPFPPFFLRFGTRLLRSPPAIPQWFFAEMASPVWPPVRRSGPDPRSSQPYTAAIPSRPAILPGRLRSQETILCNLLSPPAKYRSRLQKLTTGRSMLKPECFGHRRA